MRVFRAQYPGGCSVRGTALSLIPSAIRYGECDAALAGGTESCIGRLGYFGFSAMHALCPHFNDEPQKGSRPFDKRRCGFVMGEGGVVMLLESYEQATKRNAPILISSIVIGIALNGTAKWSMGLQMRTRITSHLRVRTERERGRIADCRCFRVAAWSIFSRRRPCILSRWGT